MLTESQSSAYVSKRLTWCDWARAQPHRKFSLGMIRQRHCLIIRAHLVFTIQVLNADNVTFKRVHEQAAHLVWMGMGPATNLKTNAFYPAVVRRLLQSTAPLSSKAEINSTPRQSKNKTRKANESCILQDVAKN